MYNTPLAHLKTRYTEEGCIEYTPMGIYRRTILDRS